MHLHKDKADLQVVFWTTICDAGQTLAQHRANALYY